MHKCHSEIYSRTSLKCIKYFSTFLDQLPYSAGECGAPSLVDKTLLFLKHAQLRGEAGSKFHSVTRSLK